MGRDKIKIKNVKRLQIKMGTVPDVFGISRINGTVLILIITLSIGFVYADTPVSIYLDNSGMNVKFQQGEKTVNAPIFFFVQDMRQGEVQNKIRNGGFEETDLAGWLVDKANKGSAHSAGSGTDKDKGFLEIILPDANSYVSISSSEKIIVEPCQIYYLTFLTKANSGVLVREAHLNKNFLAGVKFYDKNGALISEEKFAVTGSMKNWKRYTFSFEAPLSAHSSSLAFYGEGNLGANKELVIDIDNVNLYKQPKNMKLRKLAGKEVFNDKSVKRIKDQLIHTYVVSDIDIRLITSFTIEGDRLKVDMQIESVKLEERGLEIGLGLDMNFRQAIWWDNVNNSKTISDGRYWNVITADDTNFLPISVYPLSSITNKDFGICFGTELEHPLVYRMFYDTKIGYCYSASIGLSKHTKQPGKAALRCFIYTNEPEEGFRSAIQKFYSFFPKHYALDDRRKRLREKFSVGQGISINQPWKKEELDEFHIRYTKDQSLFSKEKAASRYSKYKAMGILPSFYIFPFGAGPLVGDKNKSRPFYEDILTAQQNVPKRDRDSGKYHIAQSQSVCKDTNGDAVVARISAQADDSWAGSHWWVVLPLNCDPDIPGGAGEAALEKIRQVVEIASQNQYSLMGIFIDEFMKDAHALDCNIEHFKYAHFPLTYSANTFQPAVPAFSSDYEFLAALKTYLDKAMPDAILSCNFRTIAVNSFGAIYLDSFMFETHMNGSCYTEEDWLYRRFIAGPRPVSPLHMTYGFKNAKEPKKYMNQFVSRCMGLGFYPGFGAMIEAYHKDSKIREMLKQAINQFHDSAAELVRAQWCPITYAKTDNESVTVERFKKADDKTFFLSIYNTKEENIITNLTIDFRKFKQELKKPMEFMSVVIGSGTLKVVSCDKPAVFELQIPPKGFELIRINLGSESEK